MELLKIVKYLDKKFSPRLAAKWDNPGFQIFSKKEIMLDKEINKVLVCLDVNKDVINKAIDKNVDLIISRHPFIFSDLKRRDENKKDMIKELEKNDIYVFSIHTNYDASPNQELIPLLEKEFTINKNTRFGKEKEGFELRLKNEINPEELIEKMNKIFKTGLVEISSKFNMNRKIQTFYFVSGSGGSTMIQEHLKNAVLVTGDMKWNEFIYANDNNVSVLTLGHYMENYFVDDMVNKLANSFKDEFAINRFYIGNQIKEIK